MKSLIAVALFAQLALVLSLPQGYYPNQQIRGPKLKFRAISPFGFQMSIPSLTGRETVNFDISIDQRIQGQPPKKLSFPGQAGWNRRWSVSDYTVQLNGGDQVIVTVTVNNEGQQSTFEYPFFITEDVFSSEESFEARPPRILQVSPQAAQTGNKVG